MSGSYRNQLAKTLNVLFMEKGEQDAFKKKHGVVSVKKALRPGGDPTKPLPVIVSEETRRGYFRTASTFFKRAQRFSHSPYLVDWFEPEIIRSTLDKHYRDLSPDTINTLFPALTKVWQGCVRLGWVSRRDPFPITDDLRDYAKAYRDDGDVRLPRYGYADGDAERIVAHLYAKNSKFALAADLMLNTGLRLHEVAGLQGAHIDAERNLVHVVQGKGGLARTVPIDPALVAKFNLSQQYLFAPLRSWRHAFDRALRRAARALEIQVSGGHRLRSNCFQSLYRELIAAGKTDAEARDEIARRAGHQRRDVVSCYVQARVR